MEISNCPTSQSALPIVTIHLITIICLLPQYHYNLGILLHTMTKGSNVADEIIFSVTDQINYGIEDSSAQSPELRIDLAKLNEMAGAKAVDRSDFVTARSYLNTALSLLPANHWKSHYELSLRLSFLLAQSANSCGDVEKAQLTLEFFLNECHGIEDKLSSYYLRADSKCQHLNPYLFS